MSRLERSSDAVFGFAITLLVVSLEVIGQLVGMGASQIPLRWAGLTRKASNCAAG